MFAGGAFSELAYTGVVGLVYGSDVHVLASGKDAPNMDFAIVGHVVEGASGVDTSSRVWVGPCVVRDAASFVRGVQYGDGFAAGSFSSGSYSGLGGDKLWPVSGDHVSITGQWGSSVTDAVWLVDRPYGNVQLPLAFESGAVLEDETSHYLRVDRDVAEVIEASAPVEGALQYESEAEEYAAGGDINSTLARYFIRMSDVARGSLVVGTQATYYIGQDEGAYAYGVLLTNLRTSVLMSQTVAVGGTVSSIPLYPASVTESASVVEYRNSGYGFSSGAFMSGPFGSLNGGLIGVSGDQMSCFLSLPAEVYNSAGGYDAWQPGAEFGTVAADVVYAFDLPHGGIDGNSSVSEVAAGVDRILSQAYVRGFVQAHAGIDGSPSVKGQWDLASTCYPDDWKVIPTFR